MNNRNCSAGEKNWFSAFQNLFHKMHSISHTFSNFKPLQNGDKLDKNEEPTQ